MRAHVETACQLLETFHPQACNGKTLDELIGDVTKHRAEIPSHDQSQASCQSNGASMVDKGATLCLLWPAVRSVGGCSGFPTAPMFIQDKDSMDNILKSSGLVLVRSSNYNIWQYEQFRKYVGDRVLEIGCGLGNMTQYLIQDAKYLLSVDTRHEAVEFTKQRLANLTENMNFNVECLDLFNEGLNRYFGFDTIVLSNVLEHIKDDLDAMRKCHDMLSPTSGKLLLIVPAHQFLYGTLDKESGHWRRYSKNDIIKLANESNFKVIDLYPFNFIGALGWYVNYCLLRRKNTNNDESSLQVSLYDKLLVKPSKYIESKIRPPIGISYIAILEAEQ